MKFYRRKDILTCLLFILAVASRTAPTMITAPAELTVTSGGNAPVFVTVDTGILAKNFTMGVGQQSFPVSRNGAEILSGASENDIASSCETYNCNPYVGVLSA